MMIYRYYRKIFINLLLSICYCQSAIIVPDADVEKGYISASRNIHNSIDSNKNTSASSYILLKNLTNISHKFIDRDTNRSYYTTCSSWEVGNNAEYVLNKLITIKNKSRKSDYNNTNDNVDVLNSTSTSPSFNDKDIASSILLFKMFDTLKTKCRFKRNSASVKTSIETSSENGENFTENNWNEKNTTTITLKHEEGFREKQISSYQSGITSNAREDGSNLLGNSTNANKNDARILQDKPTTCCNNTAKFPENEIENNFNTKSEHFSFINIEEKRDQSNVSSLVVHSASVDQDIDASSDVERTVPSGTPSQQDTSQLSEAQTEASQLNFRVREDSSETEIAIALAQAQFLDTSAEIWKDRRTQREQPQQPKALAELQFPVPPEGESFHIHDLALSEGTFVFSYLGSFLSWLQPHDFPIEVLRDALWNRMSIVDLITKSLEVEIGFVACICVAVCLALVTPLYLLTHACCSLIKRPVATSTWDDDSSDVSLNCRRRSLVFFLELILFLLVAGIVAMFVTNEQVSLAVQNAPRVIHTALADAGAFVRNSNVQMHFVVTKSLDQAVEAASADLDNVENLLGRPIQEELEQETGVDVALDALVDVTAGAQDISNKVDALHEYCAETRGLALVAQERLADLRHQVDMFRRQCPAKDRALCETVEAGGLDVVLNLDPLINNERLSGLRRLSESNLSQVTQQARGEFQFVPLNIEKETREARNGVRRQLLRQRSLLDDSVWTLHALSRDLGVRVEQARARALELVGAAEAMEQWRYLVAVGSAVSVLFVWTLLLTAVSCGCCGSPDKAAPTLMTAVSVLCPLYLLLWCVAMVVLLAGGHGEVFVCRPLYDEPSFTTLTRLVDKPGVIFQRGGGFFSNLLYGNDSLDVTLRDVLRSCQHNRPTYPSFNLHQVFDVDAVTNHRHWDTLHRQLARLEVNLSDLQLLTPDLQEQLQQLLHAAMVNLTTHRAQLSGPVTGKDLTSFADQLESVANQITDLATASRMETLATRTRRLLSSHVTPLNQRKEDIVYQLTALEVQLIPLQRQVNQSLSHLKTIQYFINNQGGNISHTKSQEYIDRIVSYVQQYRDHVMDATNTYVAPCRPVWDLFHAMRLLLCRHMMDPLNGFWFAVVWCLILLMIATPVAVKLSACYHQSRHGGLLSRSSTESPPAHIPDPPGHSRPWSSPGDADQDGW